MPKTVEHDGKYRPRYCMKNCIYSSPYGCRYKGNEELSTPIEKWQSCHYFRDREHTEMLRKFGEFDMMYGHMASYKDSHSAMWID